MFRMKRKLTKLSLLGEEIKICLIGIGKMGNGMVHQVFRITGMETSIVVDEKIDKALSSLLSAGVKREDIVITNSLSQAKKAIDQGKFVVSEDYSLGYKIGAIDAMVDATGNPPFGAKMAYESINAGKHVIMLNVECDAIVGPILNKMARERGVIYTGTKGDEPGALLELADFAAAMGFEILALGKGKNNPLNHYVTADDIREEAKAKGLYPKILASFIDGTNTMIELNAVCNATGFLPDVMGCHGIKTDPKHIQNEFKLKSQGGRLNQYKIVDFAFGMAPGVFAIVSHQAQEVKDLMSYLGMGEGPNYSIYRPFHLTSLETPITVYEAVVEKEASLAPVKGQVADVITKAKRDLKKGQSLEGMGGRDVYGQLTSHQDAKENSYLPIGLITKNTRLKEDIKKDELITLDQVDLDEDEFLLKLRKKQEEEKL